LYFGPRIGIAMGQWLLYGTGGYARANVETRIQQNVIGIVLEPTSQHHNGWYYGGGLDFLVMKNLAFGVEYRHYDFSSAHQMCTNCTADNRDVKVKADAVLLRLTIKGGG
jgi:opacity protein-like surface antigen